MMGSAGNFTFFCGHQSKIRGKDSVDVFYHYELDFGVWTAHVLIYN